MASGHVIPSLHTSTTASSSDALREARRRWSSPRSHWSWPWLLGRQEPAPCCSAPRTPTLSSSCRWSSTATIMCFWPSCCACKTVLMTIFIHVCPPGSDCVFGCHATSVSCDRQSPANHQVLLLAHFSPVWSRYSHRTKLLHTSLLPPHAQPLHHASTRLWGTRRAAVSCCAWSIDSIWNIQYFHAECVDSLPLLNCNLIFQVPSEKDTLYLHLLFALKDPSVGTLESNFASTVFYAFSALQVKHSSFHVVLDRQRQHGMVTFTPPISSKCGCCLGSSAHAWFESLQGIF